MMIYICRPLIVIDCFMENASGILIGSISCWRFHFRWVIGCDREELSHHGVFKLTEFILTLTSEKLFNSFIPGLFRYLRTGMWHTMLTFFSDLNVTGGV